MTSRERPTMSLVKRDSKNATTINTAAPVAPSTSKPTKPRIYIDTSVVGGCEDDEFREYSRRLMKCFVRGDFVLVLSNLTVQELAVVPDQVRRRLSEVAEEHIEALRLNAEAMELAEAYVSEGVIGERMRADAQHIAIATVARVDVLVSWNFKHIVSTGSTVTTP